MVVRRGLGLHGVNIGKTADSHEKTWPSPHRELTDVEWVLIAELVPDFSGNGKIGCPPRTLNVT